MDTIKVANDVLVGFDTTDPVINEICTELSSHKIQSRKQPDVIFRGEKVDIGNKVRNRVHRNADNESTMENIPELDFWSAKDAIRRYAGLLGWEVNIRSQNDVFKVTLGYDRQIAVEPSILDWTLRFINRSYIWRFQNLAKVLLYNVVEPIIHWALIHSDKAFLHASAVAGEQGAVLITGEGGAGKTTMMERMINGGDFRYMSDDLCLVSSDSKVYSYLKRVQLYPYNSPVVGDCNLQFSGLDSKIQWKLKKVLQGDDSVRRRINPSQRYNQIETEAEIQDIVFIQRTDINSVKISEIDTKELAHRSVSVITDEFDQFSNNLLQSSARGFNQMNITDFYYFTRDVYLESFKSCNIYLVLVPPDIQPDKLYTKLISEIDLCT